MRFRAEIATNRLRFARSHLLPRPMLPVPFGIEFPNEGSFRTSPKVNRQSVIGLRGSSGTTSPVAVPSSCPYCPAELNNWLP